ncbi:hypothetical protein GCM10022252_19780 [Streptosporangium oxazolinicum]|uniref:DUF4082 domain-containing protein n=1 Tax=Streptosporangium oxazolinicum TaxID=909287 RepID=A0ABP8ANR3_9ACTN
MTHVLWEPTVPPVVTDTGSAGVVMGLKFRSTLPGFVTGIRTYVGAVRAGVRTANLWTRTGSILASATLSTEQPVGWMWANFAAPVPIEANTTYVATHHSTTGIFSVTLDYFATTAHTNGPLTALATGTDGGNGVYSYNAAHIFPTLTSRAACYWITPVFETSADGTVNGWGPVPPN